MSPTQTQIAKPAIIAQSQGTLQPNKISPTSPPPSLALESPASTSNPRPRLGFAFPERIALFSILSFSLGFLLGGTIGGPEYAYRYRAENAHRLPTSTTGWYLYHRSKNYHAIVGGTKEGVKAGLKCTVWGALFMVVEEVFDRWKGKDFLSSTGAGLTTAGAFSWLHRADVFTSARIAKIALVGGTGFGIVQDGMGWIRGDTPTYVKWIRRKLRGKGDQMVAVEEEVREGNRI